MKRTFLASLIANSQAQSEFCYKAVDRLQAGPEDLDLWLGSGVPFVDETFEEERMIWW